MALTQSPPSSKLATRRPKLLLFVLVTTALVHPCYLLQERPKILPLNTPEFLLVGEKFSYTCTAKVGEPPFSFQWLKNGNELMSAQTDVQIKNFEDISLIVIDSVKEKHAGNYTCILSNNAGKDIFTAALIVKAPPTWIKKPINQEVFLGEPIVLECQVHGHPTPQITWTRLKDETPLSTSAGKFLFSNDGKLQIPKSSEDDEGSYKCEATNGVGKVLTSIVQVKLRVPARFEEKFSVETVRRGETASLKCEAIGDLPLEVTWAKDKRNLEIKELDRYERFETTVEKGLTSELMIRSTDRNDGALYTCFAKNDYGLDEKNIKLVIVEVPARPLDVRVQEVWSRSATISWSVPYSGNSPITKFIVQYWQEKENGQRLLEQTIPSSQTSVLLKSLHPGSPYAVTVVAENEVGQGMPSQTIQFVTGEEAPVSPPTDVQVKPKGSSSLLVTWKPPPKELWNGELRGYYIDYKVNSSPTSYLFKTVESSSNDSYEYILSPLMKATRYSVVVKAYNGAGTGPPSEEITVKTLEGDLPLPPPVELVSNSDSAISLKWGKSPSHNIPVTGYTLHYKKKNSGEWNYVHVVASDNNMYTIKDLESGATYQLYLTAVNQFGRGNPSDYLSITTNPKGIGIGLPFYLNLAIVVPVTASVVAFVVVLVVIVIFVKKTKARKALERDLTSLQSGKVVTYAPGSQRYIDMEKARRVSNPEPGTPAAASIASYASIPSRDLELRVDDPRQELKSFLPPQMRDRPLPHPKPSSLKKRGDSHLYDRAD
ncbi:Down syndrome cell adhesion molecule-like protein 1 homolog isoform X2 [Limulus polyphemus]|uniref:Down syndrome cell adhesion molecule-like protein 1 homolog isoform X2 n=1 Tax=Limulus polyphemus TaxID=6850 RepID=A0ABM1RXV3_LIMPO|nr:Down syndrome cell adhesion molecule-like protein 1 homolog isoform X2 [Limulus polyphemus]